MGYNWGMVKYFFGVILLNMFPMYVFGSGILTSWEFLNAFAVKQSVDAAISVATDYYIAKLTPFPLDEFLTVPGFEEVVMSIGLAVVVGSAVASVKWRAGV
jgi:hypothetical protein